MATIKKTKSKKLSVKVRMIGELIDVTGSSKDSWNPSEISDDMKAISYIRKLSDTWNPAQLNEALKYLGFNTVDTWNPAELEETKNKLVKYFLPTDASGNPIELNLKGELPYEVTSLSVALDPIQDLHGYDYPWVGGAGKNLLPMTLSNIKSINTSGTWTGNNYVLNGVTFAVQVDSDDNVVGIKVNGTASANTSFTFLTYNSSATTENTLPVGSYVLSGCPSGGSTDSYYLVAYVKPNEERDTGSGVSWTVTDPDNDHIWFSTIQIANGYNVQNLVFKPMIRKSTESATFAPYTNICPISGRTGTEVVANGRNVWDEETENGYISAQGDLQAENVSLRSVNYTECKPNTSYYGYASNHSNLNIAWYDSNKTFISRVSAKNTAVTSPSNAYYFKLSLNAYVSSGTAVYANDICVNVSDASFNGQYVPYVTPSTATLSFGQTVYGGTVDFKTGKVTVEWEYIASYDGETLPGEWISDRDEYASGTTPTTGAEVAYKLATPTELTLTPQELELLKGYNYIYTDGDNINITYKANLN